ILIDFLGVLTQNAAYSLSHLGGGLAGFVFVYMLRKGKDGSIWMNSVYDWFMNLFNPNKKKSEAPSIKEKVFYNSEGRKPYNKNFSKTYEKVFYPYQCCCFLAFFDWLLQRDFFFCRLVAGRLSHTFSFLPVVNLIGVFYFLAIHQTTAHADFSCYRCTLFPTH